MKLSDAKILIAAAGCTFKKTDDEFRINLQGGHESTAYYTNDIDDAVLTAVDMRKREDQRLGPIGKRHVRLREKKTAPKRVTIRAVNAALKIAFPDIDIELVRNSAHAYHYFAGDACGWYSSSVYTPRTTDYSIDEWVDWAKHLEAEHKARF